MSDPSVSVVIPTHNRKVLLQDAINNCLEQTIKELEVIVVDDGSSDDTEQMVFGSLDTVWPRDSVCYVKQENRGASSARNHGLRLAKGEYVQFLDSDDLLEPTKLEKQVRLLEQPGHTEAVCCSCFGRTVDPDNAESEVTGERIGCGADDPKDLVRELCSRRVHGFQTSAPLWRRSYLLKHAGWREDISLGDDLEYGVRLLSEADDICFVEDELFFIRVHSGSRLSADEMTESALGSLIETRRSVYDSVKKAALWDEKTQGLFLDAMRTIYANALAIADATTVRELEAWMWKLATEPKRRYSIQLMFIARRLFGRYALLIPHRWIKRFRAT